VAAKVSNGADSTSTGKSSRSTAAARGAAGRA